MPEYTTRKEDLKQRFIAARGYFNFSSPELAAQEARDGIGAAS